jgi:hypothetical protein
VPETSEDGLKRQAPDLTTLIRSLHEAGVNYVLTGSAAAMLHGVGLVPGDLDITPALDIDNLTRLATNPVDGVRTYFEDAESTLETCRSCPDHANRVKAGSAHLRPVATGCDRSAP